MLDTRTSRLATLCVLVAILTLLAIWFGLPTPPNTESGRFPDTADLARNDDAYTGQHVQVSGRIVQLDPVVITASGEYWTGDRYRVVERRVTITDPTPTVTRGQELQVYGVLRQDGSITATNSVVVPTRNRRYMYGVSALAGVWVLARLIRGWTIIWGTLAMKPRQEPTTSPATRRQEGSTDA